MAAHIVTALTSIISDINQDRLNWKSLQDALNLASWTEDISFEEYGELQTIVTERSIESITPWLDRILPIYTMEWETLGKPTTREEWNKRRHDRFLESQYYLERAMYGDE
jgi:hypothetical protein